MTHPNSHKMTPFELPASFGDEAQPTADFIEVDPREHALDCLTDYADLLYGDIVLVPVANGEPDWKNTTRDTIEKFAGDWTELKPEDVPRLGVLTDSFARFLGHGDDVSVVTLWRGGTPDVRQIGGDDCLTALCLITEALIDDEPLKVLGAMKPKASPKANLTKADNDNQEVFLINPADWHGKPVPRREWFIEDMIPMRQVTIFQRQSMSRRYHCLWNSAWSSICLLATPNQPPVQVPNARSPSMRLRFSGSVRIT
ncbi:hypothetical protein [Mesorhizobium cantuariense]|uniref:Uncharacterized protein n=1 Tax=Mesorhizobium cantuariense TaxID=1300275 RepID=A0ABV7MQ16_9HYPH